jgi:hypothetical protein
MVSCVVREEKRRKERKKWGSRAGHGREERRKERKKIKKDR